MNLTIKSLNLRLKYPFTISRESKTVQHNVLAIIKDKSGVYGHGEAAPVNYVGEDATSVKAALRRIVKSLAGVDAPFCIEDITNLEVGARHAVPLPSASARAAIDIALHDLVAKKLKIPLYKLLGLNPNRSLTTSFTIGLDSIDIMQKKVEEAGEFPILKVKLGVKNDLKLLKAVRDKTDAVIRVDANAGWTVSEAIRKINAMKDLGVEFVEQPIRQGNVDGLKKVRDNVDLPIIVDEDVHTGRDIIPLAGAVDGINIKLMKCGGIREAIRMIHIARAHGLKIMLGCMIESSVAITAAAHLTPLVDYADLDGNILITNDPFTGVTVKRGKLLLPERAGLGLATPSI